MKKKKGVAALAERARVSGHSGKPVKSGKPAKSGKPGQPGQSSGMPERDVFSDYTMIFVVMFLLVIGLVALYSTSSYEAALDYNGDSFYYLKRQLIFSVMGLVAMLLISRIPVTFYRPIATYIYAFSVLLVLLIVPFGYESNGAKRWINLGFFNIQPAEVSKIAVILMTAAIIYDFGAKGLDNIKAMVRVLLPAAFQCVLIYLITSNLSSAIIIFAIAFFMYFVACKSVKPFVVLTGVIAALAGVFLYLTVSGKLEGFRSDRILAWLNPEAYSSTTSFQTLQALYAIGSGGLFGKGLGQSVQKLGYLPEAQNDMIFSIICEEMGIFGAVGIILLFLFLIWRLVVIASNCKNLYSAIIVVGVTAHIAVQVVLNIAVVTNTIPNTGVSLPFISYGGSAIVLLLTELGVVLSVARYQADEDE